MVYTQKINVMHLFCFLSPSMGCWVSEGEKYSFFFNFGYLGVGSKGTCTEGGSCTSGSGIHVNPFRLIGVGYLDYQFGLLQPYVVNFLLISGPFRSVAC
ncbi:hypothetical protein GLYMA_15G061151v4 [Glycine max]|nr:hypothetical protein GYH30_041499 [Glycine max]KRH10658.2 hypothetical protein GLYMA_15G061151v4 [Glycine max]